MKNNAYSYPVFVVNSGIAKSGHREDLAPGQLGLFSRATYSVVSSPAPREEVFFAYGSTRSIDKPGNDMAGYKQPTHSAFFKIKDVLNFEVSYPEKESKSNKVSIGYSGGSCSDSLAFECGKNYVLKFYLKGSPVLRYFGKPVEAIVSYNTGCCPSADCVSCPDETVDAAYHTKKIIEELYKNIDLKQAGLKAMFVDSVYSPIAVIATGTATIAAGVVTDVTGIVGGKGYTNGATVAFGGPGTGATATVTVVAGVVTAVTITAGGTGYITAPVVTFSKPANMKTKWCLEVCDNGDYLALSQVQANVAKFGTVTSTGRKDCKTKYEYCGDVKAADLVPTQEVALSVCGTCAPGYTLVAATDTYTIERVVTPSTVLVTDVNKTTFANAVATAYSGTNAVFNSLVSGVAVVSIDVPKDTVLIAINSDLLTKGATKEASCKPTVAATPIAWIECGVAYKVDRKLKITLQRQDCAGGDRLAELTAFYANNPNVVSGSLVKLAGSIGCEDCYEIKQWSKGCMSDECLSVPTATFDTLTSFAGQLWEVVPEPAVITPGRKVGITVEFDIPEVFFSNSSFSPDDFYEDEPIFVEIGWELNYPDVCALGALPKIKEIRGQKFRRQSGEWVVRELINASAYSPLSQFSMNPRIREAFGQEILSQVDRKAFYRVYYPKFVESRAGVNTFGEQPQIFEPMVIFKEGDATSADFEAMFSKAIAPHGVSLNLRSDLVW